MPAFTPRTLPPPPASRGRRAAAAAGAALVATLGASAAAAAPPVPLDTSASAADGRVLVWVELSEPALKSQPAASPEQHAAQRGAIDRQQSAIAARLAALGGQEQGRLYVTRNALAVALPPGAVAAVRQWSGVVTVRPVTHPHRVDTPAGPGGSPATRR